MVGRVFATVEVLRLALISYRGIWGLAWRVLVAASLVMSILVAWASRGNVNWALLNADRGFHLIFATATIACLLLIRHYRISLGRVYRTLLATLCFYSCMKILINTVLQNVLYAQFLEFGAIWQIASLFSYIVVLLLWAGALARPLPVIEPQQAMLSPSVYEQISPEINFQLQEMNRRLMSFWKIKDRQP